CSSRSSAGPRRRSATRPPLTGGPGWSSPLTPSSASPGPWPRTCAAPGRSRPRRAGSLPRGSAGDSGTSARRSPARPARRNPESPAPGARQAPETGGQPHVTTWASTAKRTQLRRKRVKSQAEISLAKPPLAGLERPAWLALARSGIEVRGQALPAALPSEAGLPVPAERARRVEPVIGVGPDHARAQPLRHPENPAALLGPDPGRQSVRRVVRLRHGFLWSAERQHRQHRAEDLLPGDAIC